MLLAWANLTNSYTPLARANLTVLISEMWEDFWMMRLVRVFPTLIMEPTAQLCQGAPVGPIVQALPMIVVLVALVGPLVQLRPVVLVGIHISPWARLVRATAAWISPQSWPSITCWPRSRCCSLWTTDPGHKKVQRINQTLQTFLCKTAIQSAWQGK